MKKLSFLSLLIFGLFQLSFAQLEWGKMMDDPQANVHDIKQKLADFRQQHPGEKIPKPFLRWLERSYAFADQQGDIQRTKHINAFQQYSRLIDNSSRAGNWTHLGPVSPPEQRGIARFNSIAFHPNDPNIIFAGSASGGLYKTTNQGLNWTTTTDSLPALGVSDVVINPQNPQIMYWATGDNDGNSSDCYGLLKSTDGGIAWTNVLDFGNTSYEMDEVIIDPRHPDTVLLACSRGVYRTADAGLTWTRVVSIHMEDIIFHPTSPDIVYASGNANGRRGYYRSTDNGVTWTSSAAGLPTANAGNNLGRMMLAVTPAEPNYVYLLIIKNGTGSYAYHGLYRSTDAGVTFTAMSELSSNLNFRQGWYDLMVQVDPNDADLVYIADWELFKSTDGGIIWSKSQPSNLHVDLHDFEFHPKTGDIWIANDGGMYQAPNQNQATNVVIRSEGLAATQFYRMGTSVHEASTVLTGSQDNGTMEREGVNWTRAGGGDGMECLISWEDPDFQVTSSQNGFFNKRQFGNATAWLRPNTTGEDGAWTTPFIQDHTYPRTYYAGYESVWITENQSSWRNLSGDLNSGELHKVIVPQISQGFFIYATTRSVFHRTLDKGVSWARKGLPGSLEDLVVNPRKPQELYGAFANGVFKSIDAGDTWTDITRDLPPIPVTAIVYQRGGPEALYVGTTTGIYYTDSTLNGWIPFLDGLPNVEVRELEISYCAGKLRAATYGRGLWESELYPNGFQLLDVNIEVNPGTDNMDAELTADVTGGYGPFTYAWDNFQTTPNLMNPTSGAYSVTITDKNHCVVTDTAVLMATAIEDLAGIEELVLYPNPTKDVLNISFEGERPFKGKIQLYNTLGQVVLTKNIAIYTGKNKQELSLTSLDAGMYILHLQIGEEGIHHRVIKE